jgi:hypothetical protein
MKAQIEETQGADFPAASLNVIYQGKVCSKAVACPTHRKHRPCVAESGSPCIADLVVHVRSTHRSDCILQVLKDATTLKDNNVTEAGFCVVMVMKVGAAIIGTCALLQSSRIEKGTF